MANFKQAVLWKQEGKRPTINNIWELKDDFKTLKLIDGNDCIHLDKTHLNSNDWELYEEDRWSYIYNAEQTLQSIENLKILQQKIFQDIEIQEQKNNLKYDYIDINAVKNIIKKRIWGNK